MYQEIQGSNLAIQINKRFNSVSDCIKMSASSATLRKLHSRGICDHIFRFQKDTGVNNGSHLLPPSDCILEGSALAFTRLSFDEEDEEKEEEIECSSTPIGDLLSLYYPAKVCLYFHLAFYSSLK